MKVIEIPAGLNAYSRAKIKGVSIEEFASARAILAATGDERAIIAATGDEQVLYEMFRELVNEAEAIGYTEICLNRIDSNYRPATDILEITFRIYAFGSAKTEPRKALKDIAWF